MVTEEEIKILARRIWEAEGCPFGKDVDHYFRAKKMLDRRDKINSGSYSVRMYQFSHSASELPARSER